MDVEKWFEGFEETKTHFERTRVCPSAVVRIGFDDGSHVYVQNLQPGPGPGYLTIYPYPEDPSEEMIPGSDEGLPVTPTALLVPLSSVNRIEMLVEASRRNLGFGQRSPDVQ